MSLKLEELHCREGQPAGGCGLGQLPSLARAAAVVAASVLGELAGDVCEPVGEARTAAEAAEAAATKAKVVIAAAREPPADLVAAAVLGRPPT